MQQACFVNSDEQPIKVIHHNIWSVTEKKEDGVTKVYTSELVTYHYPHPDAPDDATVSLLTFGPAIEVTGKAVESNLKNYVSQSKTISNLMRGLGV